MNEIDFVLTYLDSNDIEWQRERNQYKYGETADVNPNRYRDWTDLRYFFRGVEKFAPWVRKVHLVTCGHIPDWLNTEHPKVNVVKHSSYIPEKWLPTFSSRCIDMNLHRISELSEQFVYFNDDMVLSAPVKPTDFFVDGKPCDSAILSPRAYEMTDGLALHIAPIVGAATINKHFRKNDVLRKNPGHWFNLKYGSELLRTLSLSFYPHFISFLDMHLPYSYLKSTYETVWREEEALLTQSSAHRFREPLDINHWIFTYWQYASGNFSPRSVRFGKCFQVHDMKDAEKAAALVKNQRYKAVCLNDGVPNNAGGYWKHNCLLECGFKRHTSGEILLRKVKYREKINEGRSRIATDTFECVLSLESNHEEATAA